MNHHLFRATVVSAYQKRWNQDGEKQYVVAAGRSRSNAAVKAMRKVYAIENQTVLHSVELEWLGLVEVAQ